MRDITFLAAILRRKKVLFQNMVAAPVSTALIYSDLIAAILHHVRAVKLLLYWLQHRIPSFAVDHYEKLQ